MTADVFVIGAIRLHRESIAAALDAAANVMVVGQASTLEEALPQLRDLEGSAVALLLDAPLRAQADLPLAPAAEVHTKVVAVGVPEDEAVAWIEAGISGFVPPDATPDETIAALESAAKGHLEASPEVAGHLASRVRSLAANPRASDSGKLTARETEILGLIVEGRISRSLSVSRFKSRPSRITFITSSPSWE